MTMMGLQTRVAERYLAHREQRHTTTHVRALNDHVDRMARQLGGPEPAATDYFTRFRTRIEEDGQRYATQLREIDGDDSLNSREKRMAKDELELPIAPAWSAQNEADFIEGWGEPRDDPALVSLLGAYRAASWIDVTMQGVRERRKTQWELTVYELAFIRPQDGSEPMFPLNAAGQPVIDTTRALSGLGPVGNYRPTQPPVRMEAGTSVGVEGGSPEAALPMTTVADGHQFPDIDRLPQEAPPAAPAPAPAPAPAMPATTPELPVDESGQPVASDQLAYVYEGSQIVLPTVAALRADPARLDQLVRDAEGGDLTLKLAAVAGGLAVDVEPREIQAAILGLRNEDDPAGNAPHTADPRQATAYLEAQQKAGEHVCPHCLTFYTNIAQHEPACERKHQDGASTEG